VYATAFLRTGCYAPDLCTYLVSISSIIDIMRSLKLLNKCMFYITSFILICVSDPPDNTIPSFSGKRVSLGSCNIKTIPYPSVMSSVSNVSKFITMVTPEIHKKE